MPDRPLDGFVVVDKPAGWTSHDVVARLRRLAGTKRVGHAGTLDPMATGVLVVGIGRATKLLTYVVGADKDYEATIRLGVGTTTDDAEGEVTAAPGLRIFDNSPTAPGGVVGVEVSEARLGDALVALTGEIEQVPSSVSAIKVGGERAYALVREGKEVRLTARPVTVRSFVIRERRLGEVDSVPVLDLDVAVTVSSGTYVRALARDLGALLGSAGHLTALRRTRVGGFTLDGARTPDQLAEQVAADGALHPIPLARAARAVLPARSITADEARELRFGRRIAPTGRPGVVAVFAPDDLLVALVTDATDAGGNFAKPVLVVDVS